ncbi:MAG: tRNA dihydrouridine synthase DusB [Treponemataceae bacterium]
MPQNDSSLYHDISIGNLHLDGNLFLAPIAGYSDVAFRSVCVDNGASFTYTEMISSEALIRGSEKTKPLLTQAQNEKKFAVQLFGGNPIVMAEATKIVLKIAKPNLIDINAGCPVPKITKTGAGSFLTQNPNELYKIVHATVKAIDDWSSQNGTKKIPVTIKIRSGWDSEQTWKEAARAGFDAGCAAITLHPRSRMQGYDGSANWDYIAKLSSLYKGIIPILGSGDIFSPEKARNMLTQTQCDAVMFARGAMGNPFIFNETKNLLQKNTYESTPLPIKMQTALKELDMLIKEKTEPVACREMRKRFCAYSKGMDNGAVIRKKIIAANNREDYTNIIKEIT